MTLRPWLGLRLMAIMIAGISIACSRSPLDQDNRTKPNSESSFLTDSLDVTVWTVGPNFRGHSVPALREALLRANPFKSEFETVEEHRNRFPPAQLLGRLTPDSYLASPISSNDDAYPTDLSEGANFKYDAQTETFTISVLSASYETTAPVFATREIWTHSRTWVGDSHSALLFSPREFTTAKWTLRVPRSDAQDVSANVRVVMVFKVEPFLRSGFMLALLDERQSSDLPVTPKQF